MATRPIFVAGPALEPVVALPVVPRPPSRCVHRPCTNGPVAWQWDFGDVRSSDRNPTHVFAEAGVYPVSLMVTNEFGQRDRATRESWWAGGDAARRLLEHPHALGLRVITFDDLSDPRRPSGHAHLHVDGAVVTATPGERTAQFTFAQAGTLLLLGGRPELRDRRGEIVIAAGQQPPRRVWWAPRCSVAGSPDAVRRVSWC